jgi:hypothetical protein
VVIDYNTALGRVRLRISDLSDIPYLTDNIILASLTRNNNNENLTAKECSMYILGMMSGNSHQKFMAVEVFGNQIFEQYQKYLMMLYRDPNFSGISPIPYSSSSPVGTKEVSKINTFIANNEKAYVHYNSDETLQFIADANDNSSAASSGWTLVP